MGETRERKSLGATMKLNYAGLGKSQISALNNIADFANARGFYLAGGTALSLYFGHRKSVDLDWFTSEKIEDSLALAAQIREKGFDFQTEAASAGTLHGSLTKVRVTFLEYKYPLLQPFQKIAKPNFNLASLDDLACMKLSAIAQRGARKDFCDIYALVIKHRPLSEMLELYKAKFGVNEITPVIYGLNYFDDAETERMPIMVWNVSWSTIKKTIQQWLK